MEKILDFLQEKGSIMEIQKSKNGTKRPFPPRKKNSDQNPALTLSVKIQNRLNFLCLTIKPKRAEKKRWEQCLILQSYCPKKNWKI